MTTAAPVGGTITSGVVPNRSFATAPDIEQKKRLQARQEHDFVSGKAGATRPAYALKGPTPAEEAATPDSNLSIADAKTAGRIL